MLNKDTYSICRIVDIWSWRKMEKTKCRTDHRPNFKMSINSIDNLYQQGRHVRWCLTPLHSVIWSLTSNRTPRCAPRGTYICSYSRGPIGSIKLCIDFYNCLNFQERAFSKLLINVFQAFRPLSPFSRSWPRLRKMKFFDKKETGML
jgi:hypothetical protein